MEPFLQEFNTLYLTRFRTYKNALQPQTKPIGGEGASDKINTCRNVPLQDTFFRKRHFGIAFYQSNLSTHHILYNYCARCLTINTVLCLFLGTLTSLTFVPVENYQEVCIVYIMKIAIVTHLIQETASKDVHFYVFVNVLLQK